jgi:hypothetical protein
LLYYTLGSIPHRSASPSQHWIWKDWHFGGDSYSHSHEEIVVSEWRWLVLELRMKFAEEEQNLEIEPDS